MAIKGNLQKKVYSDPRTGVKRRWMQYSMVTRWLNVRDKTTDWGPPLVVTFSILLALCFFGIAKINNDTDGQLWSLIQTGINSLIILGI